VVITYCIFILVTYLCIIVIGRRLLFVLIFIIRPVTTKIYMTLGNLVFKSNATPFLTLAEIVLIGTNWSLYYELLKPNKTVTGPLYRRQMMRLNRALKEKHAYYYSRHELFSCVICSSKRFRPRSKSTVSTWYGSFRLCIVPIQHLKSDKYSSIASQYRAFFSGS